MSSENDLHEIVAHSAEHDPAEALRDALSDILAGLIAAATPTDGGCRSGQVDAVGLR